MRKKYLLFLIITIGNYWFWRMIKLDFFVGGLSLLLSILLSSGILSKFNNKISIAIFMLFFLISLTSLINGSDRGLFLTQPLENDLIERRHEYFAKELGQIYRNRIGLYYHKRLMPLVFRIQKNFFSNLDINLYFFASHPRERVGISEFAKYPFLYLPLFILGLIKVFRQKSRMILGFFMAAALVSTFLHPTYNLGPVLFFPLINLLIVKGLLVVFKYEKI